MKKVLLFLTLMFLMNCNNVKNKTPLIEKQEVKKELKDNVLGKWISVNDYLVKDIFISASNSKTYNFKITFKDGSLKNESIKINYLGEYQTNNKFGEYYKIRSNNTLGFYDKQGLIGHYRR